jgi:hypothetical protein
MTFLQSYWGIKEAAKNEVEVEAVKARLLNELEECFGLGEIEEARS